MPSNDEPTTPRALGEITSISLDAEICARIYRERLSRQCSSSSGYCSSTFVRHSSSNIEFVVETTHEATFHDHEDLIEYDAFAPTETDSTVTGGDDLEHSAATLREVGKSPDFIVAFRKDFDESNPLDWPVGEKGSLTNVLSASVFTSILVSTLIAPALSTIATELRMNATESVMALSVYMLASAFGPLCIGPLAEVYGREPVLHVSNLWFLFWNVACGFATSKELLIVSRFLAGSGASAICSLAGAVLGDIWRPEQRGKHLGWHLTIPLLAAAAGPIIGGFATTYFGWRWMFWGTSIVQAVQSLYCCLLFQETFAPVVLERLAARLRAETGDDRFQTLEERLDRTKSVAHELACALGRPLRLLALHPIIQMSSLLAGFQYGILYLLLATYANLWESHYGRSVSLSGLHYIAYAAGELAGSQIGAILMDRLSRHAVAQSPDGQHRPEYRLPLLALGAVATAAGLAAYGCAAQLRLHWALVDAGMFAAVLGQQLAGMALQAYVLDAYADHAGSALAALQVPRGLAAFLFPLAAPAAYAALGYGWAHCSLALGTLVLGLPVPFLLWCFRVRLRKSAENSV